MALEVIERNVFHITNREVAADLRQALAADNIERLDDLILFMNEFPGATSDIETSVLTIEEITARPKKGQ
jgi:hypothetical protein